MTDESFRTLKSFVAMHIELSAYLSGSGRPPGRRALLSLKVSVFRDQTHLDSLMEFGFRECLLTSSIIIIRSMFRRKLTLIRMSLSSCIHVHIMTLGIKFGPENFVR